MLKNQSFADTNYTGGFIPDVPGKRLDLADGIWGKNMKSFNLKKVAAGAVIGIFAFLGASTAVNAQDSKKEQKQQQKIQRQQAKIDAQRARLMRERQSDWARRNNQMGVNRRTGTGYYTLETNGNIASGRYRVNRNGSYYNTDQRGAELLRNAVNAGYRQGFNAGRTDYSSSRRTGWSNSNVYRSGNFGYQNGVDARQYQYYFQQGFQRGYQDGSNSEYNQSGYNGSYRYGTYDNGSPSILSTILNQILNIQSY